MAKPGDTYFNPVTRTKLVFVVTSASSGGRELAIEWFVPPGERLAAAAHCHAGPDGFGIEHFDLLEGSAACRIGRQELSAKAPHTFTIPANTLPRSSLEHRDDRDARSSTDHPADAGAGHPRRGRAIFRDPDGAEPARTRQPQRRHPKPAARRAGARRRASARHLHRRNSARTAGPPAQRTGWSRPAAGLPGPHHARKGTSA